MKHFFNYCGLVWLGALNLWAQGQDTGNWNLVSIYHASTHVFYGELTQIIPEPGFRTGALGVYVEDIDWKQLPKEEIIWPHAQHVSFRMSEVFKGDLRETFTAYLADTDPRVWTYIMNEVGDAFLAKPERADARLAKLAPGDHGLYFIRHFFGTNIPIIYRVRTGRPAEKDLALLRAHKAADNIPLHYLQEQARMQEAAQAQHELAEFRLFEDEYYKILRIQDLEIRKSLLNDLIARLGFAGRWSFFDFKERYLKEYGDYVEDAQVPSGPTGGKEKLWKDASEELAKIDFVLQARSHR